MVRITVVDGLLRVETGLVSTSSMNRVDSFNPRSLFACETLVDDLGLVVYSKILRSCSIG